MTDAVAAPAPENKAVAQVLTAAWLAVGAGIAAQLIVVAVRASLDNAPGQAGFLADMAQSVSWSLIVCAALAIGTLATKARMHLSGLIGLLAGPLAWASAKGVQKGVQALLGVPQDQLTPLFWAICAVKGVEYAALGAGLSMIVKRPEAKLTDYLSLGAIVGLAAAGIVVALNHANASAAGTPLPLARIAALAVNEISFATLCAGVIYLAQHLTGALNALRSNA